MQHVVRLAALDHIVRCDVQFLRQFMNAHALIVIRRNSLDRGSCTIRRFIRRSAISWCYRAGLNMLRERRLPRRRLLLAKASTSTSPASPAASAVLIATHGLSVAAGHC